MVVINATLLLSLVLSITIRGTIVLRLSLITRRIIRVYLDTLFFY